MEQSSRKWWSLAAVGSGTFMSTIDGSIVNIALKTLQDDFQTTFSAVEWVVLAYLLAITCLLLVMGRLGDMIGHRRVYVAGFVVFTAASALCGLAWSVGALVGFRVVQAVGAAMIQAVGAGLLVSSFPPTERGQALGYIGTIVAAGISIGPVLGGVLLRNVGWPSIFYVNVPIGIVAIALALRALPDDSRRSAQRFDVVGAALLGLSLLLILLSLTEGQQLGFGSPLILGALAGGLLLLAAFLAWERRTPEPMIDLALFASRPFSMALLSAVLAFVAIAFNIFLLPYYLQTVLGYDPQRTGLTLLAGPLALSVVSPLSGRLSDRIGTRWLAAIGLGLSAIGLASTATLTTTSSQLDVILRLVVANIGFGIFQSPNTSTVMGNAPRPALGVAGSLIAVMRTLGQTAGIALAGAVFAVTVTAAAGRAYDPVTSAPAEALVSGLRAALLLAGAIAALGVVPALLRAEQPREEGPAERPALGD